MLSKKLSRKILILFQRLHLPLKLLLIFFEFCTSKSCILLQAQTWKNGRDSEQQYGYELFSIFWGQMKFRRKIPKRLTRNMKGSELVKHQFDAETVHMIL